MTRDHASSIKDDTLYEDLRDKGMDKEKAARIANARAGGGAPSQKGGAALPYEAWTVNDLRARARELGVEGRSSMTKDKLIAALRDR